MRPRSVVLATCFIVVMSTVPAFAAVSPCQGNPTSRYVGAKSSFQSGIWGSRADIERYDPDLCGAASVSVAWSMVTAQVENNYTYGWAQVGYGRFGANSGFAQSGYKTFAQYVRKCDLIDGDPCNVVTKFDPAPTAGAHTYKNQYRGGGDDHIHMYSDGTQVAETGFNPVGIWDNDWQAQFSGETKHLRTDVPGKDADRVRFSSLEKQTSSTGDWASINNTTHQADHCRYNYNGLAGTNFEIWTKPLNSTSC